MRYPRPQRAWTLEKQVKQTVNVTHDGTGVHTGVCDAVQIVVRIPAQHIAGILQESISVEMLGKTGTKPRMFT